MTSKLQIAKSWLSPLLMRSECRKIADKRNCERSYRETATELLVVSGVGDVGDIFIFENKFISWWKAAYAFWD